MMKAIGAIFMFLGIIFLFGASFNKRADIFLLEAIFGPILLYIGLELLR